MRNVQVRITHLIDGVPTPGDFALGESAAPAVRSGQFLCRARWLSLDRCAEALAGGARVRPGEVLPADGVGEVIESRHDVFGVGECVVLPAGLQTLCLSDGAGAHAVHPGQSPSCTALGVLGAPGMAAYFGLLDAAKLQPGETVLVSGAAGAAGATAGQIAMLRGARAVGIAGSKEQCDWVVRSARFSACIDARSEDLGARLKALAPRGIDVCFDDSDGAILETLLAGGHFAANGRAVLGELARLRRPAAAGCAESAPGAHGPVRLLHVSAREYAHRRAEFLKEAIAWHGSGLLAYREEVTAGLESAPARLCRLLHAGSFGVPLVKVH